MSDQYPKTQLFSKIMQNSRLEMPFSDFEERTMARINQEIIVKRSLSKYKKLSTLFFIIGAGLGFGITYLLSLPQATIAGISSATILLICRTVFVLVALIQLESIIGLLSKSGNYSFSK
jgi:hypothetical protein